MRRGVCLIERKERERERETDELAGGASELLTAPQLGYEMERGMSYNLNKKRPCHPTRRSRSFRNNRPCLNDNTRINESLVYFDTKEQENGTFWDY